MDVWIEDEVPHLVLNVINNTFKSLKLTETCLNNLSFLHNSHWKAVYCVAATEEK